MQGDVGAGAGKGGRPEAAWRRAELGWTRLDCMLRLEVRDGLVQLLHAQAAVSARVARHYLESSSLRERDLGAFHLQVALPSYHP